MACRRKPAWMALVLIVLVAMAAVGEGFLTHTDDGCATETHCLTCRSVLSRTAEVSLVPAAVPVVALSSAAPIPSIPAPESATRRNLSSRGPPAA